MFCLFTVNIVSAVKLHPVDGANFITDLKIILSPKGGVLQNKFGNHCFISIFRHLYISSTVAIVTLKKNNQTTDN